MTRIPDHRSRTVRDRRLPAEGRLLALLAGALLPLAAGPAAAQPGKEQHAQAAAALTKLGAKVVTHHEPDGTVFTDVSCYESSFGPKWKGAEVDLKHLQGLTNLRSLSIDWRELTDAGMQHLGGLTSLKWLNLHHAKITDQGLGPLRGLTGLVYLHLGSVSVTAAGLGRLSLKSLEKLELSATLVAEIDLQYLPKLKYLGTSTSVERIHAKGKSDLKTLSLYHAPTTDAGLADVRNLTNLEELSLIGCTKITDKGLEAIKGLDRLKILDLREVPSLTDTGLVHVKGLTALEILRLSQTKVADAGLVHLQALKSLVRLELDDTQVTDAGLQHLHGLPKLGSVWCQGTKVTPMGVQELKKALPNLVHP